MRRVAAAALMVGLLTAGCDGTAQETTLTTTLASTSTTAVTTTTSTTPTTTTTGPPFAGIVLLTPDNCDTCDDLADTLTELARGEVPIQVAAAPEGDQRPTVQVLTADGTVAAEWKGVEATVHPSDRASVENAEAMIRAACEMLGGCSPDTTSTTTTIPADLILQPNDSQCGMEVERRYNFDGTRPAPLGKIWGRYRFESQAQSVVLSGILTDFGLGSYVASDGNSYPVWHAEFCFGERDGLPVIADFVFGWRDDTPIEILFNTLNPAGISDMLPFGNSAEARDIFVEMRATTALELSERLVVGRQYVFEVRTEPPDGNFGPNIPKWINFNGDLAEFLRGNLNEQPVGRGWLMNQIIFAPSGRP